MTEKRRFFIFSIIIFMPVSFCAAYSGGSGEPNNPYQIADANNWQQLMNTSAHWDKHFIMTADIDLAGVSLTPVGIFTGVFDGNGHVIHNVIINLPSTSDVGLFGYLDSGGQIKNLGVKDVNTIGGNDVGGLVGCNYGRVTSCYVTGIVKGTYEIGGIVGWNEGGSVTFCYATGTVTGDGGVGGLVGWNNNGSVTSCHAATTINGSGVDVGGLVGVSYAGSVTDCYATGMVIGFEYVGGLVGVTGGNTTSSYSTCSVSGLDNVGGLTGENSGSMTSCYATSSVSGQDNLGGLVGWNHGNVTSCYATGIVSGQGGMLCDGIGGLVGANLGTVTSCYATGSVSGYSNVGGLAGGNGWSGLLSFCYATGSVSGDWNIGGLLGGNRGNITFCYATGSIAGTYGDYVGGLIGQNNSGYGSVNSSFWDIQTSGQNTSAGGTGETTDEMKTKSTFTNAGWDFVTVWKMLRSNEDYPRLYWQEIFPGDVAGLYGVDGIDLEELTSHWLQTGCPTDCEDADIDKNGYVDFSDFAMLAADWLKGTSPEPLVGDFTVDLKVDYADLNRLTSNWLSECSTPGWCDGTDLDQSGTVDFNDYAIFAPNWMKGIPW